MKKSSYYFLFVFMAVIIGVVFYLSSDNLIIALVTFSITIIVSFVLFIPKIKKYKIVTTRYHECFHFVNNFIISLSIKKSITGAMEATSMSMSTEYNEFYATIKDMHDDEKIKYLNNYFPFFTYSLFLRIIDLWVEQGGDILDMSSYLLSEARYEEEYVSETSTSVRKKLIEIGSLWLITLVILVFLRFALRDFYDKIKNQFVYLITLIALFVFVIVAIYVIIHKTTTVKLKGYNPNEKIL